VTSIFVYTENRFCGVQTDRMSGLAWSWTDKFRTVYSKVSCGAWNEGKAVMRKELMVWTQKYWDDNFKWFRKQKRRIIHRKS